MSLRLRAGSALVRLGQTLTRATWSGQAGWSIVSGSTPSEFQSTGREVRLRGWERNPVVNACTRAAVDILAAVDFEAYRKRADGNDEVIPEHDAALLLNVTPRADISGNRLRAFLGTHYLLYGNGLLRLERSGRRVSGLSPIHPENLKYVYLNESDQAVRFDWQTIQGQQRTSPAEDIIHFRDLTASPDALFGYPRAAAALQDIVADYEATQYVRQVVTNHGAPGLLVKVKGFKRLEDMTAAEDRFNEKWVAHGKRGGAQFIGAEETEVEQIGFDLAQLEFPDLRRVTREDICAVMAVDPRIVGIQSAAKDGGLSGEQYREARFRLIQQAVMPIMKNWEAELNRWYMPEFGTNAYIRFNPDTLSELTEDEAATATRGLSELAAGAISVEEYRDLTGRDTELDPTHHIIQSGSLTAVATVLAEAVKTPADKAAELAEAAPKPANAPGATQRAALLNRVSGLTPEQRLARWQDFDTRAAREESAYATAARILFAVERAGVSRLFGHDAQINAIIARLAVDYGSAGEFFRGWVARYEPLIAETMRQSGESVLPVGLDFNLENPRVRQLLDSRVNNLAGSVTDTTYKQIVGLVDVGRAAGMGTREIADLINDAVFGGTAEARSLTIARTETVGALNAGEHAAAMESGVFRSKEWLTQGDGRVRHSHAAIDGERAPLNGTFSNGLHYPGDQAGAAAEIVNCRCALLYHDEEA